MHTLPAANHKAVCKKVFCAIHVAVLLSLLLPSSFANGAWSHFNMVRTDAQGDYLWSYPENWSDGVPNAATSIEIGDDTSRRAMHCVVKTPNAACAEVQIAEHGLTDGSSLTVKPGAKVTAYNWLQVGKDELGILIVEGTVKVANGYELSLGGVWDLGGGLVIIRSGGLLEATGKVSLNKSRNNSPTTSDSRIEVYGTFSSGNGMGISSNDPYLPGSIWIGGSGQYTNLGGTVNVEVGSLEVEGGSASISTQSLRFHGADTVLKLSGDGISTINATSVTFDAGTLLDVRHLNVPNGTYTVIDGTSITDNGLAFAPGTDTNVWSFQVVGDDLRLTANSGGLPINAAPMAVADGYCTVENTPLNVVAAGVLANDTDPNPDTLTAVLVAGPSHAAAFTLNSDGSFVYMPVTGWSGLETFTYKANDGRMDSPFVATVRIIVDSAGNGPTGYWKLDDETGVTATDSSGNDNHGTLIGATWTEGQFGGATQFDGWSDVISISDRGSNWELDLRDGLTIALWIYPDVISSARRLVSKDNAYEFQAIRAAGNSKYSLRLNNQQLTIAMTELKEARWQHVAATWDQASGTVRYYYNGKPDGTAPFAGPLAMNNNGLGIAGRPAGKYSFAGRLDEVRIYRRALSPDEIAALAALVPPNYPPAAVDDPDYVTIPGSTLSVNAAAGVLANDSDPNPEDTLTAELATGPSYAQSFALNADGSFVYIPAVGFEGTDYFTYRAFDGKAYSPTAAQATITVLAPPTATGWYSLAVHSRGVGEAPLEISDDGLFSDPRSSGIAKLQVKFSAPLDEASLLADNVMIAGFDAANQPVDLAGIIVNTAVVGDSVAEITFTPGLPDHCRYRVRLDGLQDALGRDVVGGVERIFTSLRGDVSGDLRVNATDLSAARAARTKLINPDDANQVRADVSCDGRINATDMSRIRTCRGADATAITDPILAP